MQITSADLRDVKDWLQARLRSCRCHCCAESNWDAREIVVFHTDDLCNEIVGQLPRVVQVVCQSCGQTLFFDLAEIKNSRRRIDETLPAMPMATSGRSF